MKRVVFIGQAPAKPGSKHNVPGTYLRPWLYGMSLDDETITTNCRFYALIQEFPGAGKGGHLRPTPAQIAAHQPSLMQHIRDFAPDIIVPVGAMAITDALGSAVALSDVVGNAYTVKPFGGMLGSATVIPLPHPSGRSAWPYLHQDLLDKALALLRSNLVRVGSATRNSRNFTI